MADIAEVLQCVFFQEVTCILIQISLFAAKDTIDK